jgi:hypothetical protein
MIALGSPAPRFGCSAWSDGGMRRLSWSALHTGPLLLLFDAQAPRHPRAMKILDQAARRLSGAARLALVCRGPLRAIERWARTRREPPALTVILDLEDYLAEMYDLVSADGATRWGRFIIDADAIVRQTQVCGCRIPPDADDLVRDTRAVAACSAFEGVEGPCPEA